MKTNHASMGLAALILAVGGIFTLGLTIVPALICALVSKREAKAVGQPPHRYVTATIVVSILAGLPAACLWAALFYGSWAA